MNPHAKKKTKRLSLAKFTVRTLCDGDLVRINAALKPIMMPPTCYSDDWYSCCA